jgi:glycosyltransferase involved in cell wall biosynthesis
MSDGRPIRVAIFGESYLPYRSGVTISTEALAHGLAAAGHEPMLVVPRPRERAADRPPEHFPVVWLPSYQLPAVAPAGYRMPRPLASARVAAASVEAFRPDLIHAQSPFVSGRLAAALARRLRVPLVFTHHTRFADYRHYLGPLAAPGAALTTSYLRRFWLRCDAVVAPSAHLAAEIAASLDETTDPARRRPLLRVIPTGLDLAALGAIAPLDPRPLAGWPGDAIVVASLGRLAREKSVELLVDAFERAAAEEPQLRLLLIGGGPAEAALRARAAALGGRVHLTGALERDAAHALLKGSDLFAFASRTETQGLVLAEALACGLPVVAIEGPAVGESIRDGIDGLLLRDPASLAGSLLGLAADPARRAAMAAAAGEGAQRFDRARRIDEMVELYRELRLG